MPSKTIIFLGAGFSVGARIPVQNKILKQMIADPTKTASSTGLIAPESKKFLKSYVDVGLFLLKKFTKEDTLTLTKSLNIISYLESLLDIFDQESSIEKTNVLDSADKIIFIGYSLPLADFEVRYLLKKHISNTTKIEVVLAKNDCPIDDNDISSKPEGRYKTLFPANDIAFHYKGLKNYFDSEVTY